MASQTQSEPTNHHMTTTTTSSTSSRLNKPKQSSPFLLHRLPYELRHQIYKASLITNHPIDPHNRQQISFSPSILATCKQIHEEAAPILYGENKFILQNLPWDTEWLDDIGPHNVSLLRRVQLFVDAGPITMTEFGGVVMEGEEQRLRFLLRRLARDAKGLRHLHVYWAGIDEKNNECYDECDEDGYGMQPRWGWGGDRRFMLELGKVRGLRELVLDGAFEMSWMAYLRKQMGNEVTVRRVGGDGDE
ncbi:hypothetical protein EMCG_01777 [[Emmonsia] crescens]|uniref:Uncharacterized protein n=1 Tax=[Emmonsia] crescens TaxID=73230 RepID=A0A0G2J2A2_9EURO|nr:hypothetical protein EMCG_01777 [Emmonsia crescens UAMH 3008]